MHIRHRSADKGFTLLEVMISVGILALVAGSAMMFMGNFLSQSNLRSEHTLVLSLVKQARTLSLANRNRKAHGVKILSSTYVLFEGWSYAGRDASLDLSYNRDTSVMITGPSEIIFYTLSGRSGTTALTFGHASTTTTYAININTEGSIDW